MCSEQRLLADIVCVPVGVGCILRLLDSTRPSIVCSAGISSLKKVHISKPKVYLMFKLFPNMSDAFQQSHHFLKCFKCLRFKLLITNRYCNYSLILMSYPEWNHQASKNNRLSKWKKKVKFLDLHRSYGQILENAEICMCESMFFVRSLPWLWQLHRHKYKHQRETSFDQCFFSGKLTLPWCYLCHHQHTWLNISNTLSNHCHDKPSTQRTSSEAKLNTLAIDFSWPWC